MKLLLTKELYNKYISFINIASLRDANKELFYIYQCLIEAHETVPNNLTVASLRALFFTKYPDADKEMYLAVFESIEKEEVDPALGEKMLSDIKAQQLSMKLSEAAFKFSSGNGSEEEVVSAYERLVDGEQRDDFQVDYVSTSLSKLLDNTVRAVGLRWRLNFLNKALGSLRKGNFGFIFARPETGKTTFLASEITEMLRQLPNDAGPIIWFNNEQVGDEVMLRIYQAYFGVTLQQLIANQRKFEDQFEREVGTKFRLVDDANVTKSLVERLLKQTRPSLVVFDQIDKIKGFAADREDLLLGAIYIWARELAKTYCPVIGVCQADGTAENQKWLTMAHVANAKTSKQAEADWILGIGAVHSEGTRYIRYLNISKNKLLGDSDSIPSMRHGNGEVLIEPTIARFKDIMKYT